MKSSGIVLLCVVFVGVATGQVQSVVIFGGQGQPTGTIKSSHRASFVSPASCSALPHIVKYSFEYLTYGSGGGRIRLR
jgi:hypothetical protein